MHFIFKKYTVFLCTHVCVLRVCPSGFPRVLAHIHEVLRIYAEIHVCFHSMLVCWCIARLQCTHVHDAKQELVRGWRQRVRRVLSRLKYQGCQVPSHSSTIQAGALGLFAVSVNTNKTVPFTFWYGDEGCSCINSLSRCESV